MAETEITMSGAKRYYRALVLAYNSLKKPARKPAITPLSKEKALPTLQPLPIQIDKDKRALARELAKRINSLEAQLRKITPVGEEEQRKVRRLEAKIDIFRSKLEDLQEQNR